MLSEEEEFTLDVYHRMHMLMDPTLTNDQKEILLQDLQTSQFSKVSNEDYNSFPSDIHAYNRMTGRGAGVNSSFIVNTGVETMRADGFFDRHPMFNWSGPNNAAMPSEEYEGIMTELGDTYAIYASSEGVAKDKAREKIQSLEDILYKDEKLFNSRTANLTSDYYLSHITEGDSEYYGEDGNEVSLNSPGQIIKNGLELYANTLESAYKDQDMEPSLYPTSF